MVPTAYRQSDERRHALKRVGYAATGVVLVDEVAQHVVTVDVVRQGSESDPTGGHFEIDATVRALSVVVAAIPATDSFEVASAKNGHQVEAFRPHGPHLALCVGIGSRRSARRPDHSDAFGLEHLVEAGGELGVSIPDEERDGSTAVHNVSDQVAGRLSDEVTIWMIGDTENVGFPRRQFDHGELPRSHGVHGREVRGKHAVGLRP
jgi:hypothetical protein